MSLDETQKVRLFKVLGKLQPLDRNVQMLCLAEEAGEAIQQWRRYSGNARNGAGDLDTLDNLKLELADVIIVAKLMLMDLGEVPEVWVDLKLDIIEARGGK